MVRIPPPTEVASLVGRRIENHQWRSTEQNLGSISGVESNLVIVASDGNLGARLLILQESFFSDTFRRLAEGFELA
jgi:hypothetical protein